MRLIGYLILILLGMSIGNYWNPLGGVLPPGPQLAQMIPVDIPIVTPYLLGDEDDDAADEAPAAEAPAAEEAKAED